jgi:two-component system cell cycle response regulator
VLERAAITDDLTGLYNGRYFKLFLSKILKRAHDKRFPVTLLLFDIDNFKRYNDQFGHGVGDEILKQTASLMRRCCREHDMVARISGDEFAVIFWETEPPRQPRDVNKPPSVSRVPQTIETILDRFQAMIAASDFPGLGSTGKGTLTISGGLAVYPYDANSSEGLIEAADRALMFGAKKSGKNSIFLVGAGNGPPTAL